MIATVACAGTASAKSRSSTSSLTVTAGAVDVAAPLKGARLVEIPVTLNEPAPTRVTLRYDVVSVTALAGRDFKATTGLVTFAPHSDSASIPVRVLTNGTKRTSTCWYEASADACRTYRVALTVVSGSVKVAPAPSADAILWNPPRGQGVSIGDVEVAVGTAGVDPVVSVPVTLAEPASANATVAYQLVGGSALAGDSFVAAHGTIRFQAGQTTSYVDTSIVQAKGFQPHEVLYVKLDHPSDVKIARAVGTVIIATRAAGLVHPISRGYTGADLTQVVSVQTKTGDTYRVNARGSSATMSANAPVISANDRMAYWPSTETPHANQESCATWTSQDPAQSSGVVTQEGLALRVATVDGVTRGLTVTKGVWANANWIFNVHAWNTTWWTPFHLLNTFNLSSYLRHGSATSRLPWDVCARVDGSTLQFEVWLKGKTPPAWGDRAQGGTVTLPAGWDYAGDAGWYVGHLAAGASASYTNMAVEAPQAAPAI